MSDEQNVRSEKSAKSDSREEAKRVADLAKVSKGAKEDALDNLHPDDEAALGDMARLLAQAVSERQARAVDDAKETVDPRDDPASSEYEPEAVVESASGAHAYSKSNPTGGVFVSAHYARHGRL